MKRIYDIGSGLYGYDLSSYKKDEKIQYKNYIFEDNNSSKKQFDLKTLKIKEK